MILVSGYGLTTVLHCVGFILLYKAKEGDLSYQRLLTLNLAAAEMLLSLWLMLSSTGHLIYFGPSASVIHFFFNTFLYINIRLIIWHITIDRFLYIWLNLKYSLCITRRRLVICIITSWLISFIISIGFTLLMNFKPLLFITSLLAANLYINLSLDIIITITAITTFVYLFVLVRGIKQRYTEQQSKENLLEVWWKLKIPSLMVLSFIIFNLNSNVMTLLSYHLDNYWLGKTASIVDICGWLSDGIIYIMLQRRVRTLIGNRTNQETSSML